jgi:hypothetical protein
VGRYLCITGASREGSRTEVGRKIIRVPLALIRAGYKLQSLVPDRAMDITDGPKDHGIGPELRHLKQEDLEHLIEAPDVLEIAIVRDGREEMWIYVE